MSKITDAEANATSLDGLVNDNGLITTLRNGPKPSWQYIVDQVYAQLGYAVVGSFVDGFTYTGIRQVGVDASGNTWIYTGGEQNLPHVVPAGTVPSAPDYFQVSVNSADNVVLDNGENLQQAIDRLNMEVDEVTKNRQAIEAIYKAQGYNNVFFFEDGFTYTEPNDVGIYEDGTAWTYADANALPVTITAGTIPSEGVYEKVEFNLASSVLLDNGNTVQDLSDNFDALEELTSYATNNAKNLGDAWIKLSLGAPVTIACIGDSMTAGYDVNSPDIVPPDNGDHVTHAAIQYPMALGNILSSITGANHTIINRGYSGDTAKTGYDRYPQQISGDVAHIMFGINDSQFAFGATFPQYMEYMELLIQRYIAWGFGVVIHTPTAQTFNVLDKPARKWAAGIRRLAELYSCPVFDSAAIMQYTVFEGVYSDGTHFNSYGYQKYGDAVAAFCAAGGWVQNKKEISGNHYLSIGGEEGVGFFAPNVNLIFSEDGSSLRNTGSGGPMVSGSSITWSFYQNCDTLEISAIGLMKGLEVSFDTPAETTYDVGDLYVNKTPQRILQNKGVSQTQPYIFEKEAASQSRPVKIGVTVGKGWKNITFKYTDEAVGNKYVGGLFIREMLDSEIGSSIKQGAGVISRALHESVIVQWPYNEGKQEPNIPTATTLPPSLYIPMPDGLVPVNSTSLTDYYDHIPIEVDIYGSQAGQVVKGYVSRNSGSSVMSFTSTFTGSAGTDMAPTSVEWAYETYDKAEEKGSGEFSDGYPSTPLDNIWLKFSFSNTTNSYYQIVVKGQSKANIFIA